LTSTAAADLDGGVIVDAVVDLDVGTERDAVP
jgi:hypothetical protein